MCVRGEVATPPTFEKGITMKASDHNKIASRTVKNAAPVRMREPNAVIEKPLKERHKSDAEIMAGSAVVKINFYYDGGKQAFPLKPDMWYVRKCYPYAQPEQLLVDEPTTDQELADCKEKAKFMRESGQRYAVFKNGVELIDVD